MTKKKRGHPDIDEILQRPWCFYCERDFDDLKILINHQKAKHFKCDRCGKRLHTAGGLSVHMNQVHKENLTQIENALPNRAGLDLEVFGMEGIPEDVVQQHNQRVLTEYHKKEAERRGATGNPTPGGANGAAKKPKFESPADLKKRLAEHKAAKLAAEQNGGGSSGTGTPTSTPAQLFHDQTQQHQNQQTYGQPPSTSMFAMPQTYTQPSQQVYGQYPSGPGYAPSPQSPFGPPQTTFQHPYQQSYQQPTPAAFSPPPPPFHQPTQFPPNQYSSQVPQNGFSGQVGQHRAFNSASPTSQLPSGGQKPYHSPALSGSQRSASASLPPSGLGLPQRPAVSAPPVNQAQFQQMHHGANPINTPVYSHPSHSQVHDTAEYIPAVPRIGMPRSLSSDHRGETSIDDEQTKVVRPDLEVSPALAQAPAAGPEASADAVPKQEIAEVKPVEKKDEKKARATRLVYSDNEVSPEEKRAALAKYAFTAADRTGKS